MSGTSPAAIQTASDISFNTAELPAADRSHGVLAPTSLPSHVYNVLGRILNITESVSSDAVLGSTPSGMDSFETLSRHVSDPPRDFAELVIEFSADILVYLDRLNHLIVDADKRSRQHGEGEPSWPNRPSSEVAEMLQLKRSLKSSGGVEGLLADFKIAKSMCLEALGQRVLVNNRGATSQESTPVVTPLAGINFGAPREHTASDDL